MRKILSSFIRCERGSALILVACALIIMVLAVGCAVDIAHQQALQSKISSALDASGLAAGASLKTGGTCSGLSDDSQMQSCVSNVAQKYFDANMPAGYQGAGAIKQTVTLDPNAGSLTLQASTQQTTSFMGAIGVPTLSINSYSKLSLAPTPGACGYPNVGTCSSGLPGSVLTNTAGTSWECTGVNSSTVVPCAIYNGVCSPVPYTCTFGSPTNFSNGGKTETWTCQGSNGGVSTNCSALTPVNGVCGPTTGSCTSGASTGSAATPIWACVGSFGGSSASCPGTTTTTPTPVSGACGVTADTCSTGSLSNPVDNGKTSTWSCLGSNGGGNTNCNSTDAVNGVCGTTVFTCNVGTPSGKADIPGVRTDWICNGANGGTNPFCWAPDAVNGACGSTANTCTAGTSANPSDNGTTSTWTCLGLTGGTPTTCTIPDTINGVCNTSPNTCTSGTATGYTDNGTQKSWTCAGSHGGTQSSCTSLDVVSGQCGTTQNTCTAGTANTFVAGTSGGTSTWTCSGINGGGNASCSSANPLNGVCDPTTLYGCTAGTAIGGIFGGHGNGAVSTWQCQGSNGGVTASCSLADSVNGACGTAYNTCTAGTNSNASDNGQGGQSWTCNGGNGGTNAACSTTYPVNGVCGATYNTCNAGTDQNGQDNGNGSQSWTCGGINGGNGATCSTTYPVNGACNNSVANGCGVGTPENESVAFGIVHLWDCTGINGGGASAQCTYTVPTAGTCDNSVANGCSIGSAQNESTSGNTSTWTCSGFGGASSSPTCSFTSQPTPPATTYATLVPVAGGVFGTYWNDDGGFDCYTSTNSSDPAQLCFNIDGLPISGFYVDNHDRQYQILVYYSHALQACTDAGFSNVIYLGSNVDNGVDGTSHAGNLTYVYCANSPNVLGAHSTNAVGDSTYGQMVLPAHSGDNNFFGYAATPLPCSPGATNCAEIQPDCAATTISGTSLPDGYVGGKYCGAGINGGGTCAAASVVNGYTCTSSGWSGGNATQNSAAEIISGSSAASSSSASVPTGAGTGSGSGARATAK